MAEQSLGRFPCARDEAVGDASGLATLLELHLSAQLFRLLPPLGLFLLFLQGIDDEGGSQTSETDSRE